jgi:hypothetical protein
MTQDIKLSLFFQMPYSCLKWKGSIQSFIWHHAVIAKYRRSPFRQDRPPVHPLTACHTHE